MAGMTLKTHRAPACAVPACTSRAGKPDTADRTLFPTGKKIDEIVLPRDSLFWRRFSDSRLLLGAGTVLLMQVAHPTVGAAVRDHSDFAERPWERLLRTVDYLVLITYSGREAANVGQRVYELHRSIKGQNPDGSRYHALDPEAYAWIHATLVEGELRAYKRFVGSLSTEEENRLIAEGIPLGRLAGVGPQDLPTNQKDFYGYVDAMVDECLDNNETVQRVLRTIKKPEPPSPPVVKNVWPLLRVLPTQALHVATIGLLPETLRRRFGVPWNIARTAELKAISALSRALTPLLPGRLTERLPAAYLRRRRKAINCGPLTPDLS